MQERPRHVFIRIAPTDCMRTMDENDGRLLCCRVIESILITGIDTIVAWRVFMMQVVGEKGDKVCPI